VNNKSEDCIMAKLEERVQRLEDRGAINDVVVAYFLAADGDDIINVGACFTEDATLSASGQLCASGRQGIMDFINTSRSHMGLTVHTPHYAQVTRYRNRNRRSATVVFPTRSEPGSSCTDGA
jgi:hypothetical protein